MGTSNKYDTPDSYNKHLDCNFEHTSPCAPGLVAIYDCHGNHTACLSPNDAEVYKNSTLETAEGFAKVYHPCTGEYMGAMSVADACALLECIGDCPGDATKTSSLEYDGEDLTCESDSEFSAPLGTKLNMMLSMIWAKICSLNTSVQSLTSKQEYKVNLGDALDIVDNTSTAAITGMEITDIAAGTYLVGFSANVSLDLGGTASAYPNGLVGDQGSAAYNVNGTFSIYNGGTQVAETECTINSDVGFASYESDGLQLFPNSTWIIDVAEGDTVDLRWDKTAASTDVILNLLNANIFLMPK